MKIASIIPFVLFAACAAPPEVARLSAPATLHSRSEGPPDADPGVCWGVEETPARVEVVTEDILLQPAQVASDGTVLAPPITKTETRERIISERRELWFETLCPEELTEEFVASLQRALAVRGLYPHEITGQMDGRTAFAVRRYQAPQGLSSGVLSRAAARQMGLVKVKLDQIAQE